VPLGLVEGATVAVFVKKGYAPILPNATVNLAVALVTGAPAMANIVSFAWANLAHGRSRVGLLVALQAAFAVCVGLIAFAPSAGGRLAFPRGACATRIPAARGRSRGGSRCRALQSHDAA
jgi:hypothetical protein